MEPTPRTSLRVRFREALAIAKPYWFGDDGWPVRGRLAVILALNLGMVWLLVKLNRWNAAFYDALQQKDMAEFWHQLGIFCVIAFSYIVAAVYHLYLNQMLQIR